jgi:hypothetical protein
MLEYFHVVDGDDVIWYGQKYRLAGYDAPEVRNFRSKVDQGLERRRGYQAMLRLKTLIGEARTVHVVPLGTVYLHRTLAVLLIDGQDIAGWALHEGWGVEYKWRKEVDWGDPELPFPDLPLPPDIEVEGREDGRRALPSLEKTLSRLRHREHWPLGR